MSQLQQVLVLESASKELNSMSKKMTREKVFPIVERVYNTAYGMGYSSASKDRDRVYEENLKKLQMDLTTFFASDSNALEVITRHIEIASNNILPFD